jgi:cyclin-dependent kinase-like
MAKYAVKPLTPFYLSSGPINFMKRLQNPAVEDGPQMKRFRDDAAELVLHRKIGEGIYGKVYQALFKDDHKWRAIKVLKNVSSTHSFIHDMPCVIRELLVGGTCSGFRRSGVIRFSSSKEYGVVLDLGHCSLQDAAPSCIPLHAVRIIGKQILERVADMHDKGAMHRDLKPENILLTWEASSNWPQIQIIDYGLSSPLETSKDANVVTLWWRAPEVLLGLEHSKSLDIWAAGVILNNMCSSERLTAAESVSGALNDVWEKLGYPSQEQWSCPRPAWKGRGPLGLGTHESHAAIVEVLQSALQTNPKNRGTASSLLDMPFWTEIPDQAALLAAEDWAAKRFKKFFRDPEEEPRRSYSSADIAMTCLLDSTLAESDALWLQSAFSEITKEHVDAARVIAKAEEWPYEALELCVLIMDRTLHGSVFFPKSPTVLACSAAYVTACLYADGEPSPRELLQMTNCIDSQVNLENGVHCIMSALRYRLLSKELCSAVKQKKSWERVKDWLQ